MQYLKLAILGLATLLPAATNVSGSPVNLPRNANELSTGSLKSIFDTDNNTDITPYAKRAGCVNDQCWEYQSVCTYAGVMASEDDLMNLIGAFCVDEDGFSVEHYTVMSKTYTLKDGLHGYMAVRNNAPSGGWAMDPNLCKAGFGAILDSCEPAGSGTGSQGGYIWYYWKDLTFVIGIDRDAPTTYCDGDC